MMKRHFLNVPLHLIPEKVHRDRNQYAQPGTGKDFDGLMAQDFLQADPGFRGWLFFNVPEFLQQSSEVISQLVESLGMHASLSADTGGIVHHNDSDDGCNGKGGRIPSLRDSKGGCQCGHSGSV